MISPATLAGRTTDPSYATAANPNSRNSLWAAAAIAAGAIYQNYENKRAAQRNMDREDFYFRNGLQMKIADAKKAGISPEVALGAPTYTPQATHTPSQYGNIFSEAGQNIQRAALANADESQRKTDELLKLETLRGMKMDNDLKMTQMTSVNSARSTAFPSTSGNLIPGQGNTPVVDSPLQRTGMSGSAPHSEGSSIPSVGWSMTADGGLRPVPSQDIKNRIEDQLIPESLWATQNLVAPNFNKGPKPPKEGLPKGSHWRWSVSRQAFYPSKGKRNFGDAAFEAWEKFQKYRKNPKYNY